MYNKLKYEDFAKAGVIVCSNSKNHRMDDDVPLLIPEVNPDHLDVIKRQKERWGSGGFIVTNPNCSTIGLVLALKPIHDVFGIEKLSVVTMQALSGAGYPGVPSMDILDNVVPFIGGEEDKVETEPLKLFGKLTNEGFEDAVMDISAQCNRVNVKDGHLECVSVELENRPELDEFKRVLREFAGMPQAMELPSAPNPVIHVFEEDDRPQPRVDRDLGNGMAVSVGRIREDPVFDYKFIVLSHNTVRGAAGASILNAELMHKKGLLK